MTWGDIPILWLLTIVPILVVAYALDGQRRRRLLERIGHHQMIARMTATFSPARRRWRAVLLVAGVALLVVALARPQIPGRAKLTESRGLDLVVALDFSKSMLARDIYPTRLDRAKAELARFIDTLKGDRVGLVAFAGETMAYPLTVDYEAAKLFWRDLTPDDMPVGGTDLGKAITVATEELKGVRVREGKKRPAQVILLITDGEDTEGKGIEAARKAAALGIKIFTLGIGSNDKPPVPLYDEDGKQHGYVTDETGEPVRVGIDAAALQQMAALTGGEYVSLDPRRFGVDRVQSAIANLERTEEAARFEREPDDVGRWFLVPAFLALAAVSCVRERRRRRRDQPLRAPSVEAANAGANANANEPSQRILAAMILVLVWPLLSGFDILKRKDPNIEEGNRQLQAGKADKALEAYDRAVQALPEEPVAHFDRGVALYQLGKFPEAQKEFQRASEGHDASVKADAYYNMGNAWLKQERYKEALDAYKHTLGLRPDDRRAKWNLELALRKLQEQKQQQQSQNQQKPDDKQQQQQQQQKQQQSQQDQQKQQQQQEQQQQEQQKQEQQKQQEQQQQQQQAQADQQKQKQQQQQPGDKEKQERDKLAEARAKKEQPREIDKQDAEAVLDALERVEPTVQKDLARRRAGSRRPTKDW
ncbi:MAG TPA: VWA domain-containing protein [Polyangia bacterium]|nr:VWA domain-containing protein [Polyangia bacterium]